VSEHLPEIIAIIQKLVDKGVAYESQGDVYFSVGRYPAYAKLSKRNLDELRAGERVQPGEQKREPLDFALWKAAKPGEPAWDSPWGKGRPGWHIECSAMSAKYLGESFDIHGGGLDLIFPHHENEIAQSEGASGKTFARYWMHCGFLDMEGAKMSKSLGNVVRLRDALGKVDAEALRFFFLSTHYRHPLNFSDKGLADAEQRMEYFNETLRRVDERVGGKDFGKGAVHGEPHRYLQEFESQMDDDFNTAGALGVLSGLFAQMNELLDKPPVKDKALVGRTLQALREDVRKVSGVMGLFEDAPGAWLLRRRERAVKERGIDVAKVEALLQARGEARKAKDFAAADRLRAELGGMGVEIMDTPAGTVWKVAPPAAEA
jgi:cysteinyl-tRNA synthetase